MLGAVLISSLISSQFPKISTPLVQIGIGIALILLPMNLEVTLDPELFLVLFIAPLLFEEAKKADKPALWRLKRPILLVALALVFATTLIVGFSVHLFTPSIPLAAAFALAAALAPTDAVAVVSLKETATISEDQDHLLKGESLLNDASGIVSFQFAIAAVLTGTFSIFQASISFVLVFFGGMVVGILLMLLRYLLVSKLRSSGIDSITFHVLFEVITPFLVFLVAESLHVSGIISVVAAGITYSFSPSKTTPNNARHNIVSSSVWSVISFCLNGLVFLILGTQLPYVIQRVWTNSTAADWTLIGLIVFILFVILLLRFWWVLFMHRHVNLAVEEGQSTAEETGSRFEVENLPLDRPSALVDGFGTMNAEEREFTVEKQKLEVRVARVSHQLTEKLARKAERARQKKEAHDDSKYWAHHLQDALLLSLAGAKGAITLAVVLTIPLTLSDKSLFPERDLIIFLASGVILLSLLIANFVIPFVAPKKEEKLQPDSEINAILDIFRTVIHRLVDHAEPEERGATEEIVQQYYARMQKLKDDSEIANHEEIRLRKKIIEWERENTMDLVNEGRVNTITGIIHLDQLSRVLARVEHHNTTGWEIRAIFAQLKSGFRRTRKLKQDLVQSKDTTAKPTRKTVRFEVKELTIENYRYVIKKLKEYAQQPDAPKRVIELVSTEFERRIARMLHMGGFRRGNSEDYEKLSLALETRALEFEREAIADALAHNKISRETAKELRDNVAMMELDIEEQLE
jgi:CPA1 family monovalent cation:H+ antiporter